MGKVSSDKIKLNNELGQEINPATEEKQDDIINAIGEVETNQTDGSQKTQIVDDLGEVITSFGSPSTIAEYKSPSDFNAVYTSNVAITLSALPFVITDSSQVVYIKVIPTTGESTVLVNGSGGVTMKVASNVITVSGAGTPFASGDVYEVGINAQDKAYDLSTNSQMASILNPDSEKYVVDTLINATNVAAATNYYPSATGMAMDGFKDLCLSGRLIDADGTIDVTVEVANNPDPATAIFHQIYGYDAEANAMVNTVGCNNNTKTFVLNFENLNATWVRIKSVTSGATNTVGLFVRRKA